MKNSICVSVAFVFFHLTLSTGLAQSETDSTDMRGKTLIDAYVGALKRHDWEFIYECSSQEFKAQVCLDLAYTTYIRQNDKLTKAYETHVDTAKLEQNWDAISMEAKSWEERSQLFDECVRDKKAFYLEGLAAMDRKDLPTVVMMPDEFGKISKKENVYEVEMIFYRWKLSSRPGQEESIRQRDGDYRIFVVLDASKEKWLVGTKE